MTVVVFSRHSRGAYVALQPADRRAGVRLLTLGLDGTLLHGDGSITASTLCALRAAQARGLRLLFVTARPPRRVRALTGASELCGVAICGNGSLLYDLKSDNRQRTSLYGSKPRVRNIRTPMYASVNRCRTLV